MNYQAFYAGEGSKSNLHLMPHSQVRPGAGGSSGLCELAECLNFMVGNRFRDSISTDDVVDSRGFQNRQSRFRIQAAKQVARK
jgi:hypothetical protein